MGTAPGWVGGRAGRGVSALGSTLTATVAFLPLDSPEESQVAWSPVPAGSLGLGDLEWPWADRMLRAGVVGRACNPQDSGRAWVGLSTLVGWRC